MQLNRVVRASALLASALIAGCAGGFMRCKPAVPPHADPAIVAARQLSTRFDLVQRFADGSPAEQAQILSKVKHRYDLAPSVPGQELDYALILAAPGHAGSDPALAKQLLTSALASQPSLPSPERALAALVLQQVNRRLELAAQNALMKAQFLRNERVQAVQANRRLKTQIEENNRLRHDLADARAELKAITNIERSLIQHKSPKETTRP